MKVVICGYRMWSDMESISRVINILKTAFHPDLHIITGGAVGADSIAHEYAKSVGIRATSVSADWKRYKKATGPIRSRVVLDMNPDMVIAFHQFIRNSKGTLDCVNEAVRRGIPAFVIKKNLGREFDEFMEFVWSRMKCKVDIGSM